MMIEQATVIAYRNGVALVQCQAKSGCGSCAGQASCGTKSLSALAGEKIAPQFELKVDQPLEVGDRIELGLSERSLLVSVFWLYAVPLLVLIASTLLFSLWIEHELLVAAAVFACTAVAFMTIKKYLSQSAQHEFVPVFLRKIAF